MIDTSECNTKTEQHTLSLSNMTSSTSTGTAMPASFLGVNHLKLPADDIEKTVSFYTSVFPLTFIPQYQHYDKTGKLFASMLRHEPTGLIVEIRLNTKQAAAQRGWDPVTYGVDKRADLEEWGRWLDSKGVAHSKILTGVKGWVMSVEDPDGKFVKLYTEEEHEWSSHPDEGTSNAMLVGHRYKQSVCR